MKTKFLALCFLLAILFLLSRVVATPPQTATNSKGESVTVWYEQFGCGFAVFAQQYDKQGNPIGEKLWVSEGPLKYNMDPMVGISDSRDFIVAWTNEPGVSFWVGDVYARLYREGESGDIFRISFTEETGLRAEIEAVAMTSSGKFAICWSEYGLMEVEPGYYNPSNIHLWAQQFAPDGQTLTSAYCFSDAPFEYMGKRLRISEISATEQEITVVYRDNDRQNVTVVEYWADIKPQVQVQYQQEENPGEYAILTISPAIASKKYAVYYCDSLKDNYWSPLGKPVIAESNSLTVIDNGSAASCPLSQTKSRFYKVSLIP